MSNDDYMIATPEMIEKLRELEDAKANAKQWGEIAARHREDVIASIEAAGKKSIRTETGLEVAKVSEQVQQRFDKEALIQDHPELDVSAYTKPVYVKQLRVKNV